MIAIVDYGIGNIRAISNIYKRSNIPHVIASRPEQLMSADKALLPGVGAFDQAMNELEKSGMRQALDAFSLEEGKPILGICVGMQILARGSDEGALQGLGWIDGIVKRFDHSDFNQSTHLPHMGWNTVAPIRTHTLFEDIDLHTGCYFLHSYYFSCNRQEDVLAVTDYGIEFASIVNKDNVYGVQFHPEKSHQAGIQLLVNFADIVR